MKQVYQIVDMGRLKNSLRGNHLNVSGVAYLLPVLLGKVRLEDCLGGTEGRGVWLFPGFR